MHDRGRNNGVTGIVDISGAPTFTAMIYGWGMGLSNGEADNSGRGDDYWGEMIPVTASGQIALSGKIRADGFPLPATWKSLAGSVTLQFANGLTQTVLVVVTGSKLSQSEKATDVWDISLTCRITDSPTQSGWPGSAATGDDPLISTDPKELWMGVNKTLDMEGLASGAIRLYNVWGVSDSDGAEETKLIDILDAIIATTIPVPMSDMVLRYGNLTRLGPNAVRITVTFGLRTTRDDIEMPGTVKSNDSGDLQDSATVTSVTSSATPPSTPSAPVGEHWRTDTVQLNPGKWQHTFFYNNTPPAYQAIYSGAPIANDPSNVDDGDVQKIINTSSTPPATPTARLSSLKLRRTVSERITKTPEQWLHTFEFAYRTTEDDVVYQRTQSVSRGDGPRQDVVAGIFQTYATTSVASLTCSAIANVEFAAYRNSNPTYENSRITKIHDGMAVVERTFIENIRQVTFNMNSNGPVMSRVRMSGGTSQVYLQDFIVEDTGKIWCLLAPGPVNKVVMGFTISQRTNGATLPMNLGLTNQANNASFLGLATGSVKYCGIEGNAIVNSSGNGDGIHVIRWQFYWDSNGIIDESTVPAGWFFTTSSSASNQTRLSWVDANTLGVTVNAVTQGNFGVFLS